MGSFIPVNVNTSFGKHQEPEIHVSLATSQNCHSVIDQHPTMGQPESSEDCDDRNQHLDHL